MAMVMVHFWLLLLLIETFLSPNMGMAGLGLALHMAAHKNRGLMSRSLTYLELATSIHEGFPCLKNKKVTFLT